jgi:hypothetical protein
MNNLEKSKKIIELLIENTENRTIKWELNESENSFLFDYRCLLELVSGEVYQIFYQREEDEDGGFLEIRYGKNKSDFELDSLVLNPEGTPSLIPELRKLGDTIYLETEQQWGQPEKDHYSRFINVLLLNQAN